MIHVAQSLKQRTTPAHVIVQRLTNSFPSDRLSRAFTNLRGNPKININTAHYPRITWATEPTTTAECVHLENQHAPVPEVALATITDSLLIAEALKNAKENCVCIICNSVSSSIERYQELLKACPDGNEIEILLFMPDLSGSTVQTRNSKSPSFSIKTVRHQQEKAKSLLPPKSLSKVSILTLTIYIPNWRPLT